MKIFIKRTDFGLMYSETGNSNYHHFSDGVKTYQDMINYFVSGKQFRNSIGRYDPPNSIQLVDQNNKPYKHFSVKKIGDFYSAVIDMNESKKMMFSDNELFPKEDRRKFFSETDQDIPVTSEKDLLEYAEEKYPALVDLYHKIFAEKTDKHSVKSYIESHSEKYFSQPAVIEFE
jgi:hypothetical protein